MYSHLRPPLFEKPKPIAYDDSSRELDRMASRNQTFGSTPINCNEWLEKRAFPKKGIEQALNHSEDILPLLARAKIDHPALYSRIRLDPKKSYENRSAIKDGEFVICPFSLQPRINHEIVLIITKNGRR